MKKLLMLALALVVPTTVPGLGVAQQSSVEMSRPQGGEMKPPTPGERMKAGARVCPNCYVCKCNTGTAGCLCDGARVIQGDAKTRTGFRIMRNNGTIAMLDISSLPTPPNVGQIVRHRCALGRDLCRESALCPLDVEGGLTR